MLRTECTNPPYIYIPPPTHEECNQGVAKTENISRHRPDISIVVLYCVFQTRVMTVDYLLKSVMSSCRRHRMLCIRVVVSMLIFIFILGKHSTLFY